MPEKPKHRKTFCIVFFVLFVFILCFNFSGICTGNLLGFCTVFFVLFVFILCFTQNEDKQNKEHNTET
jgi:cytochrome b561